MAVQPRGNTAEVITSQMLKVAGLSYGDVKVKLPDGLHGCGWAFEGRACAGIHAGDDDPGERGDGFGDVRGMCGWLT